MNKHTTLNVLGGMSRKVEPDVISSDSSLTFNDIREKIERAIKKSVKRKKQDQAQLTPVWSALNEMARIRNVAGFEKPFNLRYENLQFDLDRITIYYGSSFIIIYCSDFDSGYMIKWDVTDDCPTYFSNLEKLINSLTDKFLINKCVK